MFFTKLRLAGFKSFVEATEVPIANGLTGVVGPNGCGKSNLVEAMRWVMGETSARQMRGGEMDDVIFGGTTGRPARNFAEVSLTIDNADRRAPAQFNDASELEVTRRIDRGKGSLYKVNGRETRARDVQLLFADAGTGAHSPSLISQGRVAAMIAARPADRRAILEDAAGIAGLQSRRGEAESKLKSAEANLARLEDVLATLQSQAQSLARQVRQVQRYRSLSEEIRKTEAILLAVRWAEATSQREQTAEDVRRAERAVGEATGKTAELSTLETEASAILPELRQAEAAASAQVQRLALAQGEIEAEERRYGETRSRLVAALEQIARDIEREKSLAGDADGAIRRLDEERQSITDAQEEEAEALELAAEVVAEAELAAEEVEAALQAATQRAAELEAKRASFDLRLAELDNRYQALDRDLAGIEDRRAALQADLDGAASPEESEERLMAAEERQERASALLQAAEEKRIGAQGAESEATRTLQAIEGRLVALQAEVRGLEAALKASAGSDDAGVLDSLTVTSGYEAALAAALGDDLDAPVAETSDGPHWLPNPPDIAVPGLPAGAQPLSRFCQAPAALKHRLAATGVVNSLTPELRGQLKPGQRLVTLEGALYRWDGFGLAAGAPTAAALRLAQRNRLAELRMELEGLEEEVEIARDAVTAAKGRATLAQEAELSARADERAATQALAGERDRHAKIVAAHAGATQRLAALDTETERLTTEAEQVEAALSATMAEQDALPDAATLKAAVGEARGQAAEARARILTARTARDAVKREAEMRRQRLASLAREAEEWRNRAGGSDERLEELAERRLGVEEDLAALEDLPAELQERRQNLMGFIEKAEADRRKASDALVAGERTVLEATRAAREAEAAVMNARETLIRAEAKRDAAIEEAHRVADRIQERLGCAPHEVAALANVDLEQALPAVEAAAQSLEKLTRDRDALGAVNLRAEEEAAELETQLTSLTEEREDLTQAIARLRTAITQINREGRERLLAAFEEVRKHFEELFTRLFGGGQAKLILTESEDPLAAGLEIHASPPGKKLQLLSLLSGGEQALTALSLIFAVFLTNPSPICVLDEVDAPLDDANVDRFCGLLDQISAASGTRFLVVTHHRLTMARMERLYGVTMAERGVSQLVSVDLARAERMRFPEKDPRSPSLPGLERE
ncbi:AAA family ATPase [Lacibacterium aquatile]|uniref:Chromosome partition protein Smc n=1 Tax=Lacibacterium aquatile TaxID=1168082 RepID=A0ABW5E0C0_9PROT